MILWWIITIVGVFCSCGYIFYAMGFLQKWKESLTSSQKILSDSDLPSVSLVIPFRNESTELPKLVDSLSSQDYPNDKWEVIFVNDHSEDSGPSYLHSLPNSNFHLIDMPENLSGKKAAQELGISTAKYNFILCTDADSTTKPMWIKSMVSCAQEKDLEFLAGPTKMNSQHHRFIEDFQSIEFSGIMLMTAGGLQNKTMISANGSNMLFTKSSYSGYKESGWGKSFASGDDVFLAQYVAMNDASKVDFLVDSEAIVYTDPMPDWNSFLHQRVRWAGKVKAYHHSGTKLFMLISLLIYPLIILTAILGYWKLFLFILVPKLVLDYSMLRSSTRFFEIPFGLILFLKSMIYQAYYGVIVGTKSIFSKNYEWKGRVQT